MSSWHPCALVVVAFTRTEQTRKISLRFNMRVFYFNNNNNKQTNSSARALNFTANATLEKLYLSFKSLSESATYSILGILFLLTLFVMFREDYMGRIWLLFLCHFLCWDCPPCFSGSNVARFGLLCLDFIND